MISFIYECQIILDVIMWSATLTQARPHCQQCGQGPGHVESWLENFAMPGAQHSVHIAGNECGVVIFQPCGNNDCSLKATN